MQPKGADMEGAVMNCLRSVVVSMLCACNCTSVLVKAATLRPSE